MFFLRSHGSPRIEKNDSGRSNCQDRMLAILKRLYFPVLTQVKQRRRVRAA